MKILRDPIWQFISVIVAILIFFLPPAYSYVQARAAEWSIVLPTIHSTLTWVDLLLFIWLVTGTAYLINKSTEFINRSVQENFRKGLTKWEYHGEWKTLSEGHEYFLSVTNSEAGGIITSCLLWRDYDFAFDTKILNSNTGWIIRASNILNYVMLQCGTDVIVPHYRFQGTWFSLEARQLPTRIPLNTWFRVKIKVRDSRVSVSIKVGDEEREILEQELLAPKQVVATLIQDNQTRTVPVIFSYPLGSVGFREWGDERAYFRNVTVIKQ